MKTHLIVLTFLLFSISVFTQKKTDISCKIWETQNLCSYTDSLKLGNSLAALNCQVWSNECEKMDSIKYMKAVWLSFYNKKSCKLRWKSDFKNFKLIRKNSDEIINPWAIHNSGKYYIVKLKAKKYDYRIKGKRKVNIIMLFPEAKSGDKIIIDDFIEAEIE